MLFHGPPGVGKTMLAERVPGLLPDLDLRDSLEVSAVHSLAGFNLADELITRPPYSDPHHSASVASIVGRGQRIARPGAISCAHKGSSFSMTPRKPDPSDREFTVICQTSRRIRRFTSGITAAAAISARLTTEANLSTSRTRSTACWPSP